MVLVLTVSQLLRHLQRVRGLPGGSDGKKSAWNAGDLGLIPGLERSPGKGKGYPLQYSGLDNFMDCVSPWCPKELDTTEQLLLSFIIEYT